MKLIEDGTYVVDVSEADLDKIKRVMLDTGKYCALMYPDEPEIIRCKNCKYSDENWRRVSVRWVPCMDMRLGSNWYCGYAERGEE